jgi:glycine oxidase
MIQIVGGGIIGLSCAWELQQQGHDVIVYDSDPTRRSSASWAGAGMLGALAETFPTPLWRDRAFASAYLYPEWIARLGGQIDFEPSGPTMDGHVDPRDLLRVLSSQVPCETRRIHDLSELTGDQIVVCAGAWSGQLAGLPPTEPIKGYLLAWDHFPPGTLTTILRHGHTYIFQRRNGRIIAGSTEQHVGFDDTRDQSVLDELRRRAETLFPPLQGKAVSESWHGFRPAAPDGLPVLRRHDARTVLAYGHYRNGILLAPWTARWVAAEIANPSPL